MIENYELTCMMCGTDVGQLLDGRFVPHASARVTAHPDGRRRCGRCGGSLYVEPIDAYTASLNPQIRAARIEAECVKQARRHSRGSPSTADGADAADAAATAGAA